MGWIQANSFPLTAACPKQSTPLSPSPLNMMSNTHYFFCSLTCHVVHMLYRLWIWILLSLPCPNCCLMGNNGELSKQNNPIVLYMSPQYYRRSTVRQYYSMLYSIFPFYFIFCIVCTKLFMCVIVQCFLDDILQKDYFTFNRIELNEWRCLCYLVWRLVAVSSVTKSPSRCAWLRDYRDCALICWLQAMNSDEFGSFYAVPFKYIC